MLNIWTKALPFGLKGYSTDAQIINAQVADRLLMVKGKLRFAGRMIKGKTMISAEISRKSMFR